MNKEPSDAIGILAGVLSDTHGHLSRKARQALAGVDWIIHAGDIGGPEILSELKQIATVTAVRGNMDFGSWTRHLPEVAVVELGGVSLYVLHDLFHLDLDPQAAGFQAVVNGHTHRAVAERKNGVLYINPGSATFPKRDVPASLALLRVQGRTLSVEMVDLE
jgi:putative phosphoesterase